MQVSAVVSVPDSDGALQGGHDVTAPVTSWGAGGAGSGSSPQTPFLQLQERVTREQHTPPPPNHVRGAGDPVVWGSRTPPPFPRQPGVTRPPWSPPQLGPAGTHLEKGSESTDLAGRAYAGPPASSPALCFSAFRPRVA